MKADHVIEDTQLLLAGHLVCPTCHDARAARCCTCGIRLTKEEQQLAPDPYEERIHGSLQPHLQCATCRRESVMNSREHAQERED